MLHFNYGHIALPAFEPPAPGCPVTDASSVTEDTPIASAFALAQRCDAPPDPILGLRDAFGADQSTKKLDLSVGTYSTAEGRPFVLACVQDAEAALLAEQEAGRTQKEYL